MEKKYIYMCILLAVACAAVFLIYKSQDLRREYERGIRKAFALNAGPEKEMTGGDLLTEEDLRHLPEPVRKYLVYTGSVGKEKVRNVKLVFDGEFKMNQKLGWAKAQVEQYNFFGEHLTRLFYMKVNRFGIPIWGLHTYTDEDARMRVKLAGLIPVVNVHGREMRISDTITMLNDMCLFAPASLINERIRWEPIDGLSAKAVFTTEHCTVSAILYFDEEGKLVNFSSGDRYSLESDGSCRKAKWSTPVSGYKELEGRRVVSSGEAVWNFPEGDYSYIKFTNIKEASYN